MQSAQFTPQNFVKFLFSRNCIKVANSPEEMFLLKSGRKSPLFINLGDLNEGDAMDELANAYADAIHSLISSGKMQEFDFLYGPAYKGISLGALAAAALFRRHSINVKFIYDRKEPKLHGDKNEKMIVGADSLDKISKVLIIDDVISSGKSKFEAVEKLKRLSSFQLIGVMVSIDRQESTGDANTAGPSASEQIKETLHCPLYSIAKMQDILPLLSPEQQGLTKNYFAKWGSGEAKEWAKI